MGIDMHKAPLPKPEPRKKTKARKDRREAEVEAEVRQKDADRDGYCRLFWHDAAMRKEVWAIFGPCSGDSELAHTEGARRFKTRGMEPEDRHNTENSCILCSTHHRDPRLGYDSHAFRIVYISRTIGCNYRLIFVRKDGVRWEEPTR